MGYYHTWLLRRRAWQVWLVMMLLHGHLASCNTEKTIFLAPDTTVVSNDASIDNLLLTPLNSEHGTVRTYLKSSFPTETESKGTVSWLLLRNLTPGQRYEVRVCWLATQPTEFWLHTHTLSETFETPELLSSVSEYAYSRRNQLGEEDLERIQARQVQKTSSFGEESLLFLQIFAAAEYFTMNETLMANVPPVFVDIILDPYILNIFPQSLVSTAGYIVAIALAAWCASTFVMSFLQAIERHETPPSTRSNPSAIKKSQ